MFEQKKKLARTLALTVCMVSPAPLLAGSYGESAVRDGAVTNTARSQATVPCPRLNRNIPASLAAEMDCGSAQATPRVAGERVRNNPIASFFDRFPNQRRQDTGSSKDDQPDDPTRSPDDDVVVNDPPQTPDDDDPTGGDGFTSKLDRLEELGVPIDGFGGQSEEFRDAFDSYLDENGPGGDWSDFNPPS